jgi:hypothetical protein
MSTELLILFVVFVLARSMLVLRRRRVRLRNVAGPLLLMAGMAAMLFLQRFLPRPWPSLVGLTFVVPAAVLSVLNLRSRIAARSKPIALPALANDDPAERLLREIEIQDLQEERQRWRQQMRRRGLVIPGVLLLTGFMIGNWPLGVAGLIGGALMEVTTRLLSPKVLTSGSPHVDVV